MKILVIDNYDSFTYNLVQYVQGLGAEVIVRLNDQITIEEIQKMSPDGIILSPGPGTPLNPSDVGICTEIIKNLSSIPILGVCLGHQLIGHIYGGKVIKTEPKHGQSSMIHQACSNLLFNSISKSFEAMRYHSLILEEGSLPEELVVTATTEEGMIMSIQHIKKPLYGVQFHPESIGTPEGKEIINNFLKLCENQ